MSDIQDKVFSDFEVPTTSDGSYFGRRKIIEATKEHFDMKLQKELDEVNQRLKSSKMKVKLEITSNAIQLRASLPLKPGDNHKQGRNKKQYKLSLGIPANFDGLKTAEEEAYELGRLIARQTFTWNDKYLGVRANNSKNITFSEFYEQFEKRYFQTRKRTIRSENSIKSYLNKFKTIFLSDEIITEKSIREKIKLTKSPHARKNALVLARLMCKELEIKADYSSLRLKYKPSERNIPSDDDIVTAILSLEERARKLRHKNDISRNSWKFYKFVAGIIAVYGLRPREVINKPDLKWFTSFENKHNTFKVHESNKTGYREVLPFVPEWIELFDLKKQDMIDTFKTYISDNPTASQLANKVSIIGGGFKRNNFNFQPYDLRHACAIRAHLQGTPIKAAADNLGHSVEEHTRTYQQWFGLENRRKAFKQTFEEVNELQHARYEITKLRRKVAELELEVVRLRLSNQMK